MHRVLVADPIAHEGIDRLRQHAAVDVRTGLSSDELAKALGDYDALVVRSETRVTAQTLASGGRLRVIGRAGVGVDNIDVAAATERGILVVNSPHGNTTAAAELTIALMLSLARRIPQADAGLRSGRWERKALIGTEVYGKTLGVIGLGKIGLEVARRARALGMVLVAYDPFANKALAESNGVTLCGIEALLTSADFISLHTPLNADTRGLLNAERIALMKPGVRIVNCARGGLVDEIALAEAIRVGKVAGAAIDVFASEPPSQDCPLLLQPENVVTPHLGASTAEAQVAVAVDVAEQIVEVLAGRPARSPVNMPQLSPEAFASALPYLTLAERIGSLHAQLGRDPVTGGMPVEEVVVTYSGDFGDRPTSAMTRSVLAGLLGPVLSEPVNLVNAPIVAESRGIVVSETQTSAQGEYSTLVSVTVKGASGSRTACGTAFGPNHLRVVHVDGYEVMFEPEGVFLMTTHTDKPGMIGSVGTLLGRSNVNIAGLNLGRERVGGRALMVLRVDNPITPEVLAEIRALPGMEAAQVVVLG